MQLSYELSSVDMVAAQFLFLRRRRPLALWGTPLYGALLFLLGLWLLSLGGTIWAIVPLAFGLWMMLFVPLLTPRRVKKNWVKARILHGPTTLLTSGEGLEVATPMARSFVRWEVVDIVLEGKDVWLLFIGPLNYYIVPTRAFASEEEKIRFRSELHRTGPASAPNATIPLAAP